MSSLRTTHVSEWRSFNYSSTHPLTGCVHKTLKTSENLLLTPKVPGVSKDIWPEVPRHCANAMRCEREEKQGPMTLVQQLRKVEYEGMRCCFPASIILGKTNWAKAVFSRHLEIHTLQLQKTRIFPMLGFCMQTSVFLRGFLVSTQPNHSAVQVDALLVDFGRL